MIVGIHFVHSIYELKKRKMIGILLGAGASWGSCVDSAPPLGRDLYRCIQNVDVGPRLDSEGVLEKEITVSEWVGIVSGAAEKRFAEGDFEGGMRALDDAVNETAKSTGVVLDVMSHTNEYGDISLTEKIMREVAQYLFKFFPGNNSLYFKLADFLPNGSHIFTLNYDSLFEDVCVSKRINLTREFNS
jgi:hypothetical protein